MGYRVPKRRHNELEVEVVPVWRQKVERRARACGPAPHIWTQVTDTLQKIQPTTKRQFCRCALVSPAQEPLLGLAQIGSLMFCLLASRSAAIRIGGWANPRLPNAMKPISSPAEPSPMKCPSPFMLESEKSAPARAEKHGVDKKKRPRHLRKSEQAYRHVKLT